MMPRFRMPPGPPPGAPPNRLMHPHHNKFGPQHHQQPPVRSMNIYQIIHILQRIRCFLNFQTNSMLQIIIRIFFSISIQNMLQQPPKDTKGMTTITAKPQIRNLSADVTRFVPSALRVKREDKKIQKPKPYASEYSRQQQNEAAPNKGATKDDAYMQFMREMQGLL